MKSHNCLGCEYFDPFQLVCWFFFKKPLSDVTKCPMENDNHEALDNPDPV